MGASIRYNHSMNDKPDISHLTLRDLRALILRLFGLCYHVFNGYAGNEGEDVSL